MAYRIKSNRCEGWHVPVHVDSNGVTHKGARWPTWQEAYDAIIFHSKNGKFPSEVEETAVELCPHCNQPMPQEAS